MAPAGSSQRTIRQRWNRIRQSPRFPYLLAAGLVLTCFLWQASLYWWGLKLERLFQAGLATAQHKSLFPASWKTKVDPVYLSPFEPIERVNLFGHVPDVSFNQLLTQQKFVPTPRPVLAEDFRKLKWLMFLKDLIVLGKVEPTSWGTLSELRQVQSLTLTSPPNDGLKSIAKLPRLKTLVLPVSTETSPSAIHELVQSRSLLTLKLLIVSPAPPRNPIPVLVNVAGGSRVVRVQPSDSRDLALNPMQANDSGGTEFRKLLQTLSKAQFLHRLELTCRDDGMLLTLTEQQNDSESPLPDLCELCLPVSNLTSRGLENLKNLPNLVHLDLSYTKIHDDGLLLLKNLPRLRTLYLQNCPITDDGAEILSKMTQLQSLNIKGTRITSNGLLKLGSLNRMRMLWSDANSEVQQKLRHKLPPLCRLR